MKTILIGPRLGKNSATGIQVAFESLVREFSSRNLAHQVIDRSRGIDEKRAGKISLKYAFFTFFMLVRYYLSLLDGDTVYITIGTSLAGFLRDALMIWPAWILRKTIILHLHGGGYLEFYTRAPACFQYFIKHTCSKAQKLIVLGECLRDQFSFVPDGQEKTRIVPNGYADPDYEFPPGKKEIIPGKPLKILYLSNMIPSKGYLDLIDSCRILVFEKNIPLQCRFCGSFIQTIVDGEDRGIKDRRTFDDYVSRLGLGDWISYAGFVSGDEKVRQLNWADLFVLPSAYPWEGQPISIIEAMAYRLPIISTRHNGIPDLVIDDQNGYLVEKKSPQEIADAIEKLYRHPERYTQFSENAQNRYREHFTLDHHLNMLILVITDHRPEG